MKKYISVLVSLCLLGCSEQNTEHELSTKQAPEAATASANIEQSSASFGSADAKSNLVFIKDQYLKMLDAVDAKQDLKLADTCDQTGAICFPRAYEHEAIYMEKLTKWTNGFYPGLLWKILSANQHIVGFSEEQRAKIFSKAEFYQNALMSETTRGSTHDLGFLLYDSFGEALEYAELPEETRAIYQQALATGRDTLATRYDAEVGLIKSWDWEPEFLVHYKQNDEIVRQLTPLAAPWEYPVIVDNMMNLEYMFSGDNQAHRDLAFSHAKHTMLNHYFYQADDKEQLYPIAYHVFDYGTRRPGNWQGIGNVSAWARGQGWSLYGFVTVLEALKQQGTEMQLPDFDKHVEQSIASIKKLLGDEVIPDWDYFAKFDNAAEIAANQAETTAQYSHILGLCDFQISKEILPYKGYGPIKVDKSYISEEALSFLADKKSAYGEAFIYEDHVAPCGTKPFKTQATHIPKDTSAAALYAAALYRLALHTDNADLKQRSKQFADDIMAELTENYLTSKHKHKDYELGFVLAEATGNLPNASEINTSIVYADFYFLEANILKLKVENDV